MGRTLEAAESSWAPWGRPILSGAFCSLEMAASGSLPWEPLVNTARGTASTPPPFARKKLSSHRRVNSDRARIHQAGWRHELPEHEAWWAGPSRARSRKARLGAPQTTKQLRDPGGLPSAASSLIRHPITHLPGRVFSPLTFYEPPRLKIKGTTHL